MAALDIKSDKLSDTALGQYDVVCKLADFGESRSVVVSAAGRDNLGNPLWLAPEVIRNEVHNFRAILFL